MINDKLMASSIFRWNENIQKLKCSLKTSSRKYLLIENFSIRNSFVSVVRKSKSH